MMREREKDRERERKKEKEREREKNFVFEGHLNDATINIPPFFQ